MAVTELSGVRLAGIASAVPGRVVDAVETAERMCGGEISAAEALKIAEAVGVRRRRVACASTCASDLCCAAAAKLLAELDWEPGSVDLLIFLTQTPDYPVPATSCILQHRLGLGKHCAALDINLGCSGYTYGLWLAASLISAGSATRALLLVGDVSSRELSPYDRSVLFLFGDAGCATALLGDPGAGKMVFSLGTDGGGRDHLIRPGGADRHPFTPESLVRTPGPDGVLRNQRDLFMNGPEIFTFTLREVIPNIRGVLKATGWTLEDVDAVVPHQANLFMLQHLAKMLKIPAGKLILGLDGFGNTSSASIPLAITNVLAPRLRAGSMKLLLAGFGVGFSWGAVTLTSAQLSLPDLIVLDDM